MRNAVSLLPERFRQENRRLEQMQKAVQVMACVAAAFALLAVGTFAGRAVLSAKAASLRAENNELQTSISALSGYQDMVNTKNELGGKILAVQQQDAAWLTAVYHVSRALPGGVWFESVTARTDDSGARYLDLACGGATLDNISRTLTAVEACEGVESVACSASQETEDGVSFTLSVQLIGSAQPQAQDQTQETEDEAA